MQDYVIRAMDDKGNIRVFVANTTTLVNNARNIHNTTPTASAALGRTLTAAAIMGTMLKNEKETISIQLKGGGPLGTVLAVANSKGEVKGYVGDPNVDLQLKENGKLDVGGAVGRNGKVTVIRDFGLKEPYIGQSDIVTGEIAEDLTNYFAYSEQQPSAVALGVLVDRDTSIKAAGGYIIQVLPDATEEALDRLESNLANTPPVSSLIEKGYTPEDILFNVCSGFNMDIKDKVAVKLTCDCSVERIQKALIAIGRTELERIIEEDGEAELVCHFCNQKYHFNRDELNELLNGASS
ncbi:Hsp33 family molecular chaperone HslO [Proteiniborus sp. MB09-C3]|uniref:Hsp33 family molecular chaperone HslO n=1 Tax=Proteiniborus sp. MB09-C3 TaxID=3050072 RepID=UPI002552FC8C|nr:Hsp33 family molecular chaperone HslO [Proteiniborus sp. MB09-C3]WIV11415.1 Hsp33 family molecular chaperone HslO [Proteiniborus sp. MB09-C3]